jgi:Kef-type K+ transport system membrane component KefB
MEHIDVTQFLGLLALALASAKLFGYVATRIGQPAVLGEMIAGLVLGKSLLRVVTPTNEVFHVLSELGIVILLFEIGLETDVRKLLRVGVAAIAVAIAGITLSFALGFAVCQFQGQSTMVAVIVGASLTATSVGITARVLGDLGRLQESESQIVLGAAVLDDVIGLVILSVVAGLTRGQAITFVGVTKAISVAVGVLVGSLMLGLPLQKVLNSMSRVKEVPGASILAVIFAIGLGWAASEAGSAMIIGAFAAGLLLARTKSVRVIQSGVTHLGHFFVPLFFVGVGAGVDLGSFVPSDSARRQILLSGGLLIIAAIVGKFLAGYAPFWFHGKKSVVGAGMIPRGEVALIFAQMGISSGVLNDGLFSAVALTVMATTFLAPPLLRHLLPPHNVDGKKSEMLGSEELITEP